MKQGIGKYQHGENHKAPRKCQVLVCVTSKQLHSALWPPVEQGGIRTIRLRSGHIRPRGLTPAGRRGAWAAGGGQSAVIRWRRSCAIQTPPPRCPPPTPVAPVPPEAATLCADRGACVVHRGPRAAPAQAGGSAGAAPRGRGGGAGAGNGRGRGRGPRAATRGLSAQWAVLPSLRDWSQRSSLTFLQASGSQRSADPGNRRLSLCLGEKGQLPAFPAPGGLVRAFPWSGCRDVP